MPSSASLVSLTSLKHALDDVFATDPDIPETGSSAPEKLLFPDNLEVFVPDYALIWRILDILRNTQSVLLFSTRSYFFPVLSNRIPHFTDDRDRRYCFRRSSNKGALNTFHKNSVMCNGKVSIEESLGATSRNSLPIVAYIPSIRFKNTVTVLLAFFVQLMSNFSCRTCHRYISITDGRKA